MKQGSSRITALGLLWLGLAALACNLTSPPPPTLVPSRLPGGSPQPTLGYATLSPNQQPQATPAPEGSYDTALFNLLNQVESDRLMMHVDALVSFHTRHVNSSWTDPTRGIGAAYAYIMNQFEAIRAQAPDRFFIFPNGQEFVAQHNGIRSLQRNIVAVLSGTQEGAGTIVVGAHYDSRTDDLNDAEAYAPGADDNGSGVAAVIEMARILSRHPQRATIMFVLFAAEEVGRQGSQAFVREYIQANNIAIKAMINIDTIGSYNDRRGNINDSQIRLFSDDDVTNRSPSRQLARTIEFLAVNLGLALQVVINPAADREGRYGDHFSFTEAGYPAVRFIESVEDTPNREGRDTIDGIEPAYFVQSTQTILGVLVGLAGGMQPPTNVTLREGGQDESGQQLYSLVWNPVPGATRYIVALRLPNSTRYDQQFTVTENTTAPWHRFQEYEAVAIAAVDENGLIGPCSTEYFINTR